MSELTDILSGYGVNIQETMDRFMYDEELYIHCFEMFLDDENVAQLGEYLKCGDYTAAFEAAHTYKGVVANMGLKPLYDSVCAIVEPLRTGGGSADYSAMYENVLEEVAKVKAISDKIKRGGL